MFGNEDQCDGNLYGDEEQGPVAVAQEQANSGKLAAPRIDASET